MLATVCLLAFATPAPALKQRWGWSELDHRDVAQTPTNATWAPRYAWLAGPALGGADIVAVNLNPKTTRVPGVLANVWPRLKALETVRQVVSGNPTLKASLEGRGIAADRVVGIGEGRDGKLTVFVSNV